jgi:hypothetical protein
MSAPASCPSLLLEPFSTEELDRECLRRSVTRSAEAIQRAELSLHLMREKHDRRLAELAAREARARKGGAS